MPPLTLRAAFDAGYEIVAYCRAPQCSGRFVAADRIPARLLDRPIADLVQARAFRCSRHPGARATIHVDGVNVGATYRVAVFEQAGG